MIKYTFRVLTFAKPESDNALQPEPRSSEGCNTKKKNELSTALEMILFVDDNRVRVGCNGIPTLFSVAALWSSFDAMRQIKNRTIYVEIDRKWRLLQHGISIVTSKSQ